MHIGEQLGLFVARKLNDDLQGWLICTTSPADNDVVSLKRPVRVGISRSPVMWRRLFMPQEPPARDLQVPFCCGYPELRVIVGAAHRFAKRLEASLRLQMGRADERMNGSPADGGVGRFTKALG